MKNKKKSQALSIDIIVSVVIILFGVLFLVINNVNTQKKVNLNEKYVQADSQSKTIYKDLKQTKVLNNENQVNMDKILTLNQQQLKEKLGIKNDFAITFEKNGKLVKIDPKNNVNCIGSKNIVINGVKCN